jgi:hypothetical protein
MHRPHRVDRGLRIVDRAIRRDRNVVRRPLDAPPRIPAIAGMTRHPGHGQRMQRLQHQRPDPAREHRRIRVHPPDRVGGREPPLPRPAPDDAPAILRVAPGNPRPQRLPEGALQPSGRLGAHSHSIVPGGLEVTSTTTRFTCGTSLVIRVLIFSITSYGNRDQSAVMASSLVTGRSTIG